MPLSYPEAASEPLAWRPHFLFELVVYARISARRAARGQNSSIKRRQINL